jgi:alginate O-acetyltransferase complex protein AlgI
MVLADGLAWFVADAFGAVEPSVSSLYWWLITTAFAVQIYCDFSGYSDIARGLARWMGYDFLENFNHPYVSSSLREFWARWHISLSTWFRDYLYLPLGGSRRGPLRSAVNLWITMLVSGLWHGAAWTFLLWGGCHALFLSMERLTRWPERLRGVTGGRLAATALVLAQVWVGWVFFRAESAAQAVRILRTMFSFSGGPASVRAEMGGSDALAVVLLILAAASREAWIWLGLGRPPLPERLRAPVETVAPSLMIAACVYLRGPGSAFIYFQF